MEHKAANTFKIESIFAGMHSSYWLAMCAFSGFMAVYLGHYGFSDSLIGLTASLTALITIVYQLLISSFSDSHPNIPLGRIITAVYLVILGLVAALALVPQPLVMMLLVYSVVGGLMGGMPGLYNAQIIQFVNAGLPVNLGWPRGVSAFLYALFAFFLGLLLESYTASILMPISLVCIAAAIVMVLVMPRPLQVAPDEAIAELAEAPQKTSLLQLLASSRVMQFFLLSAVFMSAGQSNSMLFLARVVQSKGGGETALGLAMFLQAGVETPAMLLSPFLMRRYRARAILSLSVLAYFFKALILYLATGMGGIYAAMALSVMCFGLYGITSVYFVNGIVRPNERVRAQSLVTASASLSAILSNLTAGLVVERFGIATLNLVCVILQAIAALLMFYCAYLHQRHEKRAAGPAAPALTRKID